MPSNNNSDKGFGMANSDLGSHTTSVKDVKQLGIWAAIASLGYVFWICGAMEMVERLAYYGVRQVSSLYATDAQSNGGLGLPGTEIGIIFLIWAMVQSFVPVLTGGISDRVGYKETIFASTIFKILGYLIMAWFSTFWGKAGTRNDSSAFWRGHRSPRRGGSRGSSRTKSRRRPWRAVIAWLPEKGSEQQRWKELVGGTGIEPVAPAV